MSGAQSDSVGSDGGHGSKLRASPQAGIALVMVLWGLTLMAIMASAFMGETRTTTKLARNMVSNAQAEALADAGVHRAVVELGAADEEGGWRPDGTIYRWRLGAGDLRISIESEGGKLDLNQVPDGLLHAFLRSIGLGDPDASALVDAIADFRDRDDVPRPLGAERQDYLAAGKVLGPKNAPFAVVDELRLVLGITPGLYERVAPLVTVYAQTPYPDPQFASAELIQALALDQAEAAMSSDSMGGGTDPEVDDPRQRDSGPAGSGSDSWSVDQLPSQARRSVPVYTVNAEARMDDGAVFVRQAVVRITGDANEPFRFYAWRRAR